MFGPLITGLESLRNFFSRSFFVGAFLPTFLFNVINSLILFVWSWPFHNWSRREVLDSSLFDKTIVCAMLFLFVWLQAYIVSALTPLWIRSLEGKNWPTWLRENGIKAHRKIFDSAQGKINECVDIYTRIDADRDAWDAAVSAAFKANAGILPRNSQSTSVEDEIAILRKNERGGKTIEYEKLDALVKLFLSDLMHTDTWSKREPLSQQITLIINYARKSAVQAHFSLGAEMRLNFGFDEQIEPTRFGNVGMSASAYCSRAFNCNLSLISDVLRRAISKETDTATNFENCKSQLDFFVACFWLSLFQAFIWAVVFAAAGEILGAIMSAVVGPAICWLFWYGAAVGQYQTLQGMVISALNSPLRHQVLIDLHFGLPADIAEERELWEAVNLALGFGNSRPLRYQFQKI